MLFSSKWENRLVLISRIHLLCYFWFLLIILLSCLGSELQHYSINYNFTKKAIRIINLLPRNFHTSPLFKQNSILKFKDKICLENIYISRSVFNTWFTFSSDQHHFDLQIKRYGKYSIIVSAIESWNKIQK